VPLVFQVLRICCLKRRQVTCFLFAVSKSLLHRAAQDLPELWLRVCDLLRVTRRLGIAGTRPCLPAPPAALGLSGGEAGAVGGTGEPGSGGRLRVRRREARGLRGERARCGRPAPCFHGVIRCREGPSAPQSGGLGGISLLCIKPKIQLF